MNSIKQIVNFDLHPLNLSSDYLNFCKNQLKNNSVLQLDNFLLPTSLNKIQNEANPFHSKAYYCSQNHTVLLNKKNKSNKNKVTKKNIKKKILSPTNKEEFYAAIDFETANNSGSSACEIGYALFTRKKIIESDSRLIQPPDKYFSSYVTDEIHHISWEDVQYEPTFVEVWNDIYPIIQDVKFIAAHNASFDKNVLKECCYYYGISLPRKKFVCTYRNISSKLWSFENNKLPTVCRHLKIPLDHHKGKSDAEACAKIVIKAFKEGWNYE